MSWIYWFDQTVLYLSLDPSPSSKRQTTVTLRSRSTSICATLPFVWDRLLSLTLCLSISSGLLTTVLIFWEKPFVVQLILLLHILSKSSIEQQGIVRLTFVWAPRMNMSFWMRLPVLLFRVMMGLIATELIHTTLTLTEAFNFQSYFESITNMRCQMSLYIVMIQ